MSSKSGGPRAGETPTPIPYKKVAILGLILSANNTSIWMIFSFLPFMVQFYFPYLTKAELGYHAGMLGSAFSAGSLFGNVIWGYVSDRLGRRPALLMGLLGTGTVCFRLVLRLFPPPLIVFPFLQRCVRCPSASRRPFWWRC